MNGSGCKNCPVNPCHTLYYRGSYCCEQRAKHGLGDPMTNADRIRAMTDSELCEFFDDFMICSVCAYNGGDCSKCKNGIFEWLQQPAEKPKEDA